MLKVLIGSVLAIAVAAGLLAITPGATALKDHHPALAARARLQAITGQTPGRETAMDPSGVPVPAGNVAGWRQVFSDNFPTNVRLGSFSDCTLGTTVANSNCAGLPATVAAKWFAYPDGWKQRSGDGTYAPSQVLSIHNHELDFYIHSNSYGQPLLSAPLPKIPGAGSGGGVRYGAFMVRFKANLLPGYKTAWLLWPDAYDEPNAMGKPIATWPRDGEIDFPEGSLNRRFWAYMHWQGGTSPNMQYIYPAANEHNRWQTALIEWTPRMVRFILNGQIIGTSTQHIPDTAMHWVLQVETNTDKPAQRTAGHVLIAWVSVYRPS